MTTNRRIPTALLWGLVILALASMSCQAVNRLVTGNRQVEEQRNQQQDQQQNQQPDPGEDEGLDPEFNFDPDEGQNGADPGGNDLNGVQDFEITGIWESQVDSGQGVVATKLILEHTGTFSQTVTWNGLMTLDTGEYNIIGNAIHFTVTHHEPTEYQGQDLSWVTSFTYFVTPLDAKSMTVEDHIMNTSWTMYKTGP